MVVGVNSAVETDGLTQAYRFVIVFILCGIIYGTRIFPLGDLFAVVFISILQKFTAGENLHSSCYLCHAFTSHWTLSKQLRCLNSSRFWTTGRPWYNKTLVKVFQVYRKPRMSEQLKQPKQLNKQKLGAWSNIMEVCLCTPRDKGSPRKTFKQRLKGLSLGQTYLCRVESFCVESSPTGHVVVSNDTVCTANLSLSTKSAKLDQWWLHIHTVAV